MRRALVALTALAMTIGVFVAAPATAKEKQAGAGVIVLSGQGNDLDAYTGTKPFKHQLVIQNHNGDPKGRDINAQICFFPDGKTFIAGEDTGQPDPLQGWGIFKLKGTKVGKLKAKQIGKLQPTYQGAADNAENYGCGILSDGRVVTTDIGNQASGPEDGQLIMWFPPFTTGFEEVGGDTNGTNGDVPFCKLDIAIGTSGGIAIDDDDRIYVGSSRGATAGVVRYTGPFPTSADAAGGCDSTDGTGAPMATGVTRENFIDTGNGLASPSNIVPSPDGGWYVSSVFTGIINEYDADGAYLRTVLSPPAGEVLGAEPYSTGTPLGLNIAPDGTLYYADIGLVIDGTNIGPGDGTGKVWRLRFVDGEPQAPEMMADGLAFPDGIGIYIPKK
ncbi:MAG: hypothetical protein EXQ79_10465 [Acidimicrobiia bacterium]|nr:hypothetical protein [Acidimicrobiia bacterium]